VSGHRFIPSGDGSAWCVQCGCAEAEAMHRASRSGIPHSSERVKLIIIVDDHGHISLEAEGPVRGREGILTLLDEARKLAEQMKP
jgi:hypothetical protein